MTPAQREAILAEVKRGDKIGAIKLCREATGMGLAEAKDFVERLEKSHEAKLSPAPEAGILAPVADLLFAGRKIDAIKLYREQVKLGRGVEGIQGGGGAARSRAARPAPGEVHSPGPKIWLHGAAGRNRHFGFPVGLLPLLT